MSRTAAELLRTRVETYLRSAPPRELTQSAAGRHCGVSQSRVWAVLAGDWPAVWQRELERRFETGIRVVRGRSFTSKGEAVTAIATAGNLTPRQVTHWFGGRLDDLGVRPRGHEVRRQQIERAIDELAANASSRDELTWERIERLAGTTLPPRSAEVRQRLRRHLARLPRRTPVSTADTIFVDSRPRRILRRSALRPDVAELAWDVLRDEASYVGRAASNVRGRHASLRLAGVVLGAAIPDVNQLSLAALQTSWFHARLTGSRRRRARAGLLGVCDLLVARSVNSGSSAVEFARCAEWLEGLAIGEHSATRTALSAEESDTLVSRCVAVIDAGRERFAAGPDLLGASTNPRAANSAADIVDWGLALVLLVGRFTGLRAESIADLRVDELAEIGHDTFSVIWRHGKKAEERLAIVPAPLARLLGDYERSLRPVRAALGSDRLFLARSAEGHWGELRTVGIALRSFTRRRLPGFESMSIALLRRTFATRSLAEGRSLAAIAAQLGHQHMATTVRYAQFERAEHAVETRTALDRYGRVVLERWNAPMLMSELEAAKQAEVRSEAQRRDCAVGICSENRCMMLDSGGAPPCLACRHLVTEPAFFPAWEIELAMRRARIERLSAPGSDLLTVAASEAAQLAEIERIYADVRSRSQA